MASARKHPKSPALASTSAASAAKATPAPPEAAGRMAPQTGAPSPEAIAEFEAMPVEIFDAAASQIEDFREMTRTFAAGGIDGLRQSYDRLRVSAEEATGSLEKSFAAAASGIRDINLKAIDTMQANSLAWFDWARNCTTAKTPVEALASGAEMMRRQFEIAGAANSQILELARLAATDTVAPLMQPFAKTPRAA